LGKGLLSLYEGRVGPLFALHVQCHRRRRRGASGISTHIRGRIPYFLWVTVVGTGFLGRKVLLPRTATERTDGEPVVPGWGIPYLQSNSYSAAPGGGRLPLGPYPISQEVWRAVMPSGSA
jgi:hypothetical protein